MASIFGRTGSNVSDSTSKRTDRSLTASAAVALASKLAATSINYTDTDLNVNIRAAPSADPSSKEDMLLKQSMESNEDLGLSLNDMDQTIILNNSRKSLKVYI